MFAAFGPEPDMQLYGRGIRRRLRPCCREIAARLELAYSLMMTLPGTPVIRYGDEIAMGDDLKSAGTQLRPHPMQWSTEPNAGFTKNDKPILPVITGSLWVRARQCGGAKPRSEFVARTGWNASSACVKRCLRLAGAISPSFRSGTEGSSNALLLEK